MKLSKYILTSTKLIGKAILTYHDGHFYSFINELRKLEGEKFRLLVSSLPWDENQVMELKNMGFAIKTDQKTNEKIALYCNHYSAHVNDKEGNPLKYKVTAAESGKIKEVDVTEELLKTFFTSANFLWKSKYDIHTYVKYYNIIRAETYGNPSQNTGAKGVVYSRSKEQTLSGAALSEYWKLLREAGYEGIKDATGAVVDWRIKVSPNPNKP